MTDDAANMVKKFYNYAQNGIPIEDTYKDMIEKGYEYIVIGEAVLFKNIFVNDLYSIDYSRIMSAFIDANGDIYYTISKKRKRSVITSELNIVCTADIPENEFEFLNQSDILNINNIDNFKINLKNSGIDKYIILDSNLPSFNLDDFINYINKLKNKHSSITSRLKKNK